MEDIKSFIESQKLKVTKKEMVRKKDGSLEFTLSAELDDWDKTTDTKTETSQYRVELSEFKGNKVLTIMKGDKRVLGFGVLKASAIVACFDAIKEFVES